MPPSDENIWNSPKHREALEDAGRAIAKVFGKQDEFEAFINARNRMVNAGFNDPNLKTLKEEYYKSQADWIEGLARLLARLYQLGLERGRSESTH